MRHHGWNVAAPVAALLLVAACGTEEAPVSASPTDAVSSADPAPADPGQLYTGFFTVLESPEHGPQLCTAVATSLPPQCGGPDVLGWNWDEAPDAETAGGVTWGFYSVTGTWDGAALTLTEAPLSGAATSPMVPGGAVPDFTSPCEPPAGGWAAPDPDTATDAAMAAASEYAEAQPDYAGTWVDESPFPAEEGLDGVPVYDPARLVLNMRFTGDLERHETALREVWGGALCVSEAARSMPDLTTIQEELTGSVPNMSGAGIDVVTGTVSLDVFVDDGLQAAMDEQYGEGVVTVTAALTPVS